MKIIIFLIVMIFALSKVIYCFSTNEDTLTIKRLVFHGFMFLAISCGIIYLTLRQADIYFNNTLIFFTTIAYLEVLCLLTISFVCFLLIGRYFYFKVKPIKINSLNDSIKHMASIGMSSFRIIDGKLIEHKENLYWAVQYEQLNSSIKNTLYISTNGKIITHSISFKIVEINSEILKRKKFQLVDNLGLELKKIG